MRRGIAIAAFALTALIVALEVGYGANFGDVLLYLAYELGFVVLPGCLLVAALRPELGGTLTGFAFGWAAGYVLEILAFDLTATLSIRGAFYVYPVLVAAATLPLIIRRGDGLTPRRERPSPLAESDLWLVAAVCGAAILYVGLSLFADSQLPGDGSVVFNQDVAWAISLTADLVHHFPLGDPNVVGEPLPYHYFVSAHAAAASQTTGIDVPLVFLRLYILPLFAAVVLCFAAAGERLFASVRTGALAGALSLLVGEGQLDARVLRVGQLVFIGAIFTLFQASPSFAFGLVMVVPLTALIGERLAADRGTPGEWALVVLMAVGASNAKVTILPLLAVALLIYGGWALLRTRRIPIQAVLCACVVFGAQAFIYLTQYRGHGSGVVFDVTAGYDFIQGMPGITTLKTGVTDVVPDFPGLDGMLDVLAVPVALLGLFGAQLAGIWLYLKRRTEPVPPAAIWLLSILAAAVIGLAFLSDPAAGNQLYFVFYGSMMATLLAAAGLVDTWSAMERGTRRGAIGLLAGFAAALAVVIALPIAFTGLDDGFANPSHYWFWYGGLVALLVALWFVARSRLSPRWVASVLVCTGIVGVGVLDTPVSDVIPSVRNGTTTSTARAGLTPDLNEALIWVNDNTDEDALLANSNPGVFNFDYAAFGERRQYLGGWGYSTESRETGFNEVSSGALNPFEDRLALNAAAFAGDPAALEALRDAGVDYLFVDKVNGPLAAAEVPPSLGEVVYENADALVIEL